MKRVVMSLMIMSMFFFSIVPTIQAEEKLDFADLIYPTKEKNQYVSLDYWDYIFGLADGSIKDRGFTHIKLNTGKYYDYWDYIFALADKKVFAAALKDVKDNYNAVNLSVKPGKVANNGTIIDKDTVDTTTKPEPEVKEFKVVDIK